METKTFFQQLLNFPKEWEVSAVNYEQSKSTAKTSIHIYVVYTADKGVDKETGELSTVFDFREERVWRHLDTMGYETYIHCKVPRIRSSNGQIASIGVPWASDNERHTHNFENYAIRVLKATHNQTQAGNILRCSYEKVNRGLCIML